MAGPGANGTNTTVRCGAGQQCCCKQSWHDACMFRYLKNPAEYSEEIPARKTEPEHEFDSNRR